jgi:hypothetical protein
VVSCSGIGSGPSGSVQVGKDGGRNGLPISFTDISASTMRPHSYKSCDDCAVRQWAEPRLFVRKSGTASRKIRWTEAPLFVRKFRCGDFDGQKHACLCES